MGKEPEEEKEYYCNYKELTDYDREIFLERKKQGLKVSAFKRKCLKCDKPFSTFNKYYRICENCKQSTEYNGHGE